MRPATTGRCLFRSLAFVALSMAIASVLRAADPGHGPGAGRPYGLSRRVPWTTSRIQGSPDPPAPYRTEPAFPKLKFSEPLAMAHAPVGNRWFVAQRYGQILSFPNDPAAERADLVLDLKRQVLGLALHPDFGKNGDLFVTSLIDPDAGRPRRVRVSRLKVGGDPPRGDPRSEQVILEWPSQYHDGGCLAFGPDGCLYIGAGDGGGEENGQGLGDLAETGADPEPTAGGRAQPCRGTFADRRLRLPRRAAGGPRCRVCLRRLRHRQDLGAAVRRRAGCLAQGARRLDPSNRCVRRGR